MAGPEHIWMGLGLVLSTLFNSYQARLEQDLLGPDPRSGQNQPTCETFRPGFRKEAANRLLTFSFTVPDFGFFTIFVQVFLKLDAGGQQQLKALSKQLQTGRDAIAQAEGADDGGSGVLGSLKADERKAIMEFYIASAEAKVPHHLSHAHAGLTQHGLHHKPAAEAVPPITLDLSLPVQLQSLRCRVCSCDLSKGCMYNN